MALTQLRKTGVKRGSQELKADPAVAVVEANQLRRMAQGITGLPNASTDPEYNRQWHLQKAKIPEAWLLLQQAGLPPGGSRDVVVAVIDTGVDYRHEDLAGNMWVNSREIPGNGIDDDQNGFIDDVHGVNVVSNSVSHTGDPIDLNGHGTHVAGIIAMQGMNGRGGVGVAYNTQIMAIRAAQPSGILTITDVVEGILYAVDQGAEVINMSFGGPTRSVIEEDALTVALNRSILVAAAGNDGKAADSEPRFPAALPYVLGVMYTRFNSGFLGDFSNFDSTAYSQLEYEIAAPGENIYSTLPGSKYASWTGTSMAAPVVSGIAALARSYFAQRDFYSSRFITAQIAGTFTGQRGQGQGTLGPSVNAYAALTAAPSPGVTVLNKWILDPKSANARNDEDGRVDAGETVQMAVELINRAGSAQAITATFTANTTGGSDPYVTITRGTLSFGSIGPWNSKDSGIVRDATGTILSFTNPFVFTVDPNTPNDHVVNFKLTVAFRNGWDPGDQTLYTSVYPVSPATFTSVVQRGRDLPAVISTNMREPLLTPVFRSCVSAKKIAKNR